MYNVLIACINWPSLLEEIRERRDTEKKERQRILEEELLASGRNLSDNFSRVKTAADAETQQ